MDELRFVLGFWEKRSAGPRVAYTAATVDYAESLPGRCDIATDHNHCTRAHVFFLADDLLQGVLAEIGESFRWIFEIVGASRGFTRRHRRRQIDEPMGIGGEAAHDLQCRNRMLFSDGDIALQPRLYKTLASDVFQIEYVIEFLLARARFRRRLHQRLDKFLVFTRPRERDKLAVPI